MSIVSLIGRELWLAAWKISFVRESTTTIGVEEIENRSKQTATLNVLMLDAIFLIFLSRSTLYIYTHI